MKTYGKDCLAIMNCAAKKLNVPAPAKDLYTGTAFKITQKFCEDNFENYCIISAKYGMLLPEQIIEPYDLYIGKLNKQQKEHLFITSAKSIKKNFPQVTKLYFLTTNVYSQLAQYVEGECIFLLDGLQGRQKLHFMKTGVRDKVDIDNVLKQLVSQLKPSCGYKLCILVKAIQDILPNYSITYINRIIRCSTINSTGEKGLKQRNIFEIHDNLYYLYGTYKKRRKLF